MKEAVRERAGSEGAKSLDAMFEIRCAGVVSEAWRIRRRMSLDALICCARWGRLWQ